MACEGPAALCQPLKAFPLSLSRSPDQFNDASLLCSCQLPAAFLRQDHHSISCRYEPSHLCPAFCARELPAKFPHDRAAASRMQQKRVIFEPDWFVRRPRHASVLPARLTSYTERTELQFPRFL